MNYSAPNPNIMYYSGTDPVSDKPGLSLESYSFMIFDLRSPEMKLGDFVKDEIKKSQSWFVKGVYNPFYNINIDKIAAL